MGGKVYEEYFVCIFGILLSSKQEALADVVGLASEIF